MCEVDIHSPSPPQTIAVGGDTPVCSTFKPFITMETLKSTPIAEFKAQNNIEKLFIIKTTSVYNDENGQPTTTNRCFAAISEQGEPYLWLARTAAEAVENGNTSSLSVSSIKDDAGTIRQVITATKRQVIATL